MVTLDREKGPITLQIARFYTSRLENSDLQKVRGILSLKVAGAHPAAGP